MRPMSFTFRLYIVLWMLWVPVACQHASKEAHNQNSAERSAPPDYVTDAYGAIIRGPLSSKKMAIVFTGDSFADGGMIIRKTLWEHQVKASFFLTGNFYANSAFGQLIKDLRDDGHYLGAHSDKHLLYADWTQRDSLLVTEPEFKADLRANYERMARVGVHADDAHWFLPPFEWYNAEIVRWTASLGFQLINFSPGTLSAADYTYPDMGARYVSSDKIFRSIIDRETVDPHGFNGFILLIHIGTDPRRTDKFYNRLDSLIIILKEKDYELTTVAGLLNQQPQTNNQHP